mgnify:FL=1
MPRRSRLPAYVKGYVDRHGKSRYYFRRKGYPSVALPGMPWTPLFMAALEAAKGAEKPPIGAARIIPRSIGDLTTRWKQTRAFLDLKKVTQNGLTSLIEWLQTEHGHRLVREMRRRHVEAVLASWSDRPSSHNRLLSLLRRLLNHAVVLEWIDVSPLQVFKKRKLGRGYATWTEEHIAAYEATWPVGTIQRTAFDLLVWTGQRSADARVMGWHQIEGDRIVLAQSKTENPVSIPICAPLAESLATVPSDQPFFLVSKTCKPFTTSMFSHLMSAAIDAAGLPTRCTPHGLRKAACRRLADAECSALEIMAVSGHRSLREAQRYVEEANQKRLANSALGRIASIGATPAERQAS